MIGLANWFTVYGSRSLSSASWTQHWRWTSTCKFILQYSNLKQAGLLEVQSFTEADKVITVSVSYRGYCSQCDFCNCYSIQYSRRSWKSRNSLSQRRLFLTVDQAAASIMIMNPGIVENPHLRRNLQHFNLIVCSPNKSHSLDSISVITD